jgi:hypothetical protein
VFATATQSISGGAIDLEHAILCDCYVCASASNIRTTEEPPHILARGPRPVDRQGATPVGDLGPLTRKVMQYQDVVEQFVPTARAAQDWAPLANSCHLPFRTHRKVPLSPRLVPVNGDAQSLGTFNRHVPDHGQADFLAPRPRVLRNWRATRLKSTCAHHELDDSVRVRRLTRLPATAPVTGLPEPLFS